MEKVCEYVMKKNFDQPVCPLKQAMSLEDKIVSCKNCMSSFYKIRHKFSKNDYESLQEYSSQQILLHFVNEWLIAQFKCQSRLSIKLHAIEILNMSLLKKFKELESFSYPIA